MTSFVYKRFEQKFGDGNNHVWVFQNIWRLGQVTDIKFGWMYLMKSAGMCKIIFSVSEEKQHWGKNNPNPGQVKLG